MKRVPHALATITLALSCSSAACSNSSSGPSGGEFNFDAGPLPDTTRDTAPFDSGSPPDTTATSDGKADGADAAVDGTVGIDTAPPDTGPPPLCPTGFSDTPGTAVDYTHGEGELLAALTWDELTMAWTTNVAGVITVHYSDRATKDGAFVTDFTLPSTLGPFPDDKVTFTADGLTMLFMSEDQQTVHQITRASRGVVFDPSTLTSAAFTRITGPSTEGGGGMKKLADLVLSKDGKWLFYTNLNRSSGTTIMLSVQLGDGSWDYPNPVDATRLEMDSGFRRRPTGISGDKRTLFYYDEASEAPYVAFRVWDTAVFNKFYGYAPTGRRPIPVDSCDRVYLSVEVADKLDAGPDADPGTTTTIVHAP